MSFYEKRKKQLPDGRGTPSRLVRYVRYCLVLVTFLTLQMLCLIY